MDLVSTVFQMDASMTQGKMQQQQFELQAQQGEIAATDEAIRGKDEAMNIRRQMLEASASINSATAGSGITASSGSVQKSQQMARGRGQKEVIGSRSNTKRKMMERQFSAASSRGRGVQARTAGYAKATGAAIKYGAGVEKRFGKIMSGGK